QKAVGVYDHPVRLGRGHADDGRLAVAVGHEVETRQARAQHGAIARLIRIEIVGDARESRVDQSAPARRAAAATTAEDHGPRGRLDRAPGDVDLVEWIENARHDGLAAGIDDPRVLGNFNAFAHRFNPAAAEDERAV